MQDIEEIFNRIQENKKKQKDLRLIFKDALASNGEYIELQEKLKVMRENKKRIELAVRQDCSKEITQLEDLSIDMASDVELLSDIALTKMMKGESLAIKDTDNREYEPVFKVSFKKIA
jgi:hypothetical protein